MGAHEKRLRAFLAHVAGTEQVDDIAQEAFVKAWQSLQSYRGEAAFFSWLCAIGWRCFVDDARLRRSEERKRNAHSEAASPRARRGPDDVLDRPGPFPAGAEGASRAGAVPRPWAITRRSGEDLEHAAGDAQGNSAAREAKMPRIPQGA